MADFYYAIATGSDLANLQNIEGLMTHPANSLQNNAIPYLPPTKRRVLSGASVRNGAINKPLQFSFQTKASLQSFVYSIWSALDTSSVACVVSALDVWGRYSPYTVTLDNPLEGEDYQTPNSTWRQEISIQGFNWTLQSTGIDNGDSPYSLTASVRLLYCNTSSGSITVNLPAASSPNANTVFSFVKTSASNTLTLDGNGDEEIDGATTKAIAALNARVDIISDGVSAWTTIS